jgi:hypothetical protein
MEERIAKLEAIIHRLLCCNNSALIGPMGPQGPVGESIQGPPGPQGPIGPAGLNWQGAWVSGVTYVADDAVGYNGASYFVTCEEVVNPLLAPNVNPCFALLANVGATGPQGPNGEVGNDGSNSGRWIFNEVNTSLPDPGSTYFISNNINLDDITSMTISYGNETNVDYEIWFKFLKEIAVAYRPLVLFQITEVGYNNVIGVYKVATAKDGSLGLDTFSNFMRVDLEILIQQTAQFTKGKTYTISWSIHSLGQMAPKTVGEVTATEIVEDAELIYDFNIVSSASKSYGVYLPDTNLIGKEIVVYLKSPEQGTNGVQVVSNSEIDLTNIVPEGTGYITTQGIDNGASSYFLYPNGNYRFTFLGNIAAGGKAFWSMEALPNTYVTLDGALPLESSPDLKGYGTSLVSTTLTSSDLYAAFPNLVRGQYVFAPNQPGGAKIFIKSTFGWLSQTLNTVS